MHLWQWGCSGVFLRIVWHHTLLGFLDLLKRPCSGQYRIDGTWHFWRAKPVFRFKPSMNANPFLATPYFLLAKCRFGTETADLSRRNGQQYALKGVFITAI